jgi:transcriptional regulator with XRE-family HTH domain
MDSAARLRQVRESLGISQRALAKELQVSSGAIALWELGERPIPGPVLKLVEIYEQALRLDSGSAKPLRQIEEIEMLASEALAARISRKVRAPAMRSLRRYLGKWIDDDPVSRSVKIRLAKTCISALKNRKGLPIKLAQLCSYLEVGFPAEIRKAFLEMQHTARAMTPGETARVVFQELGSRPEQLFQEWDDRPLSVTSISQVHRAKLQDGTSVAVKVQHAGIRETMVSQFTKVEALHWLSGLLRDRDTSLLEELRKRVLQECDYRHEADIQELVRETFSRFPQIVVPRVFRQYCTDRVLVSDFISGRNFEEFQANSSQQEKNLAAEAIGFFEIYSLTRAQLVHGDPHRDNFLFLSDGRVAFLDFGRTCPITPEEVDGITALYLAIMERDRPGFEKILLEQHLIKTPESFDFDGFWELTCAQEEYRQCDGPYRFTRKRVTEIARLSMAFSDRAKLRLNPLMFWGTVMNHSLYSIFADLEAEADWRSQGLKLAHERLSA